MKKVKVLRKHKVSTSEIRLGDQIKISLAEIGDFTATAHEITDKGVLFIFDDHVACRPMNKKDTNKGGYEASDLKKWIEDDLFYAFPDKLKDRITDLSIPTVGMIFGWDDEWNREYFEPDTDEELPLMKEHHNRIAYFNNECEWGWLKNAVKEKYIDSSFACATSGGNANYYSASSSIGVRPVFWLV